MTITKTAISASEVASGDMLNTFQVGRIVVSDVVVTGRRVSITTETGLVWNTTTDQLVSRITFGASK